jgi:hypothetical protein
VAAVEKALCQVQAAGSRRRKALEQEQQVDVGGGAQLAIGGRAKQRGGDE